MSGQLQLARRWDCCVLDTLACGPDVIVELPKELLATKLLLYIEQKPTNFFEPYPYTFFRCVRRKLTREARMVGCICTEPGRLSSSELICRRGHTFKPSIYVYGVR